MRLRSAWEPVVSWQMSAFKTACRSKTLALRAATGQLLENDRRSGIGLITTHACASCHLGARPFTWAVLSAESGIAGGDKFLG